MMTEVQLKIANLVASATLSSKFDLKKVVESGIGFLPKRFPGLIFKHSSGTILLFRTGRSVCNGVKTEQDALKAFENFSKQLIHAGFTAKVENFKVENVVGSFSIGHQINLQNFYNANKDKLISYEIEIFPGLILHLKNTTVLLFTSGKVILTGNKTLEELNEVFSKITLLLNDSPMN